MDDIGDLSSIYDTHCADYVAYVSLLLNHSMSTDSPLPQQIVFALIFVLLCISIDEQSLGLTTR